MTRIDKLGEPEFRAPHYPPQKKRNKLTKISFCLFSAAMFPLLLAKSAMQKMTGRIIVPSQHRLKRLYLDQKRNKFLNEKMDPQYQMKRITIQAVDKVKLDTAAILHPEESRKAPKEQKWLVFFNGNNFAYERYLTVHQKLSKELGINVYSGNYRGVGHSEKSPTRANDLVLDGEAMVQYLLHQGVPPENIILHGWSLGGGVATAVAAKYPNMKLVNDRSFGTLKKGVKSVVPFFGTLASHFTSILGWNLNSAKNWKKIEENNKAIIIHKKDGVIAYKASLYNTLKKSAMEKKDRLAKKVRKKLKAKKQPIDTHYTQTYKPTLTLRSRGLYDKDPHSIKLTKLDIYESYLNIVRYLLKINPQEQHPQKLVK